jgi:predicted transcriptional regulator
MNDKMLDVIFGSADRVKIIRLFVFNPEKVFDVDAVARRTGVAKIRVKKEIKNLVRIGLCARKARGFVLNQNFQYISSLDDFLSDTNPNGEEIVKRMKGIGKVKFLALAGIFIRNPESRLDILIVGDKIKENALEKAVKSLESCIGKELTFSVFDTEDFKYRLAMRDKLVMDVLDFPHEKIVNKLGI